MLRQSFRRPRPRWGWLLLLVAGLALAPVFGVLAFQQTVFAPTQNFTPAQGHSQVVAHAVVTLPQEPSVWRTVRYTAGDRVT